MALRRAEKEGIDHFHLSVKTEGSENALADKILTLFEQCILRVNRSVFTDK